MLHSLWLQLHFVPKLNFALLIFPAFFLAVGIYRVVEFQGVGFSVLQSRVLIGAHILGCALFAFALALFVLGVDKKNFDLMASLFLPAMLLLLPTHIFLGLKRRLLLREALKH